MSKLRKKRFILVNEFINHGDLKLGEGRFVEREWLLDEEPWEPELEYQKKYQLGKGVNIVHDYWDCVNEDSLEKIIDYADYISIDSRVVSKKTFDLFLSKMKEYPDKLYHRALIETDTIAPWDKHDGFFRSHQEGMEWWKDQVLNEMRNWVDPTTREHLKLSDIKSDLLPGGNVSEYIKKGMPNKEFTFVASAGEVWSLHQYLEWGFDAITLERNLLCGNVNVGIAFLRGAAAQFGDKKWGVDYTAWLDLTYCAQTSFDEDGKQIEGVSPDTYYLEWLTARISGADFAHQIFSQNGFYNQPLRPQNQRVLSSLGKKAIEFQEQLEGVLQDIGRPIVEAGIILDQNHGWCESRWDRDFGSFGKKIPYLPADKSITSFLNFVIPDNYLGTRGGMKYYQPDLPWFGYLDRLRAIDEGADRRLMEKGLISPTRYGDVFDVFVDNVSLEVLVNYPIIFILGGIKLTETHLNLLGDYVRQGGTLVLNICQYPPESHDFGGFSEISAYNSYEGKSTCKICGEQMNDFLYEFSRVDCFDQAKVLMHNEEADIDYPPLAIEYPVGKGKVITSLVYNYSILKGEQLAVSTQHLFDHLINPLLSFRITGPPIHHIVNRSETDSHTSYLTLINLDERKWEGNIIAVDSSVDEVRCILGDGNAELVDGRISATVEPFNQIVLSIICKNS